ncbi:demethoxyubiquinone hydroxylase family protein [Minwuia sp.]|uniref:demethoxyubiquinone hydroxylase family protein n=1 Tax=Minwuia sp. TaxID=2493630 RepID=UPI003A8F84AC
MKPALPGEMSKEERLAQILRVDQAGEYGAKRIYAGQLAVLGKSRSGDVIRHMAEQEERHLRTFDDLLNQRQVRPTLLSPVWHVAGYAMGAATALMGEKAAMACTEAVEEVIDAHYAAQAAELGDDEPELRDKIEQFRAEELEHRDTAREHDAAGAPGYGLLTAGVKAGSRLAIWLSTRF